MQHDGSAYLSTKRAIESAEDRGFDSGREVGADERQRLIAEYFERTGRPELAREVLSLKLVERAERPGNVGVFDQNRLSF